MVERVYHARAGRGGRRGPLPAARCYVAARALAGSSLNTSSVTPRSPLRDSIRDNPTVAPLRRILVDLVFAGLGRRRIAEAPRPHSRCCLDHLTPRDG